MVLRSKHNTRRAALLTTKVNNQTQTKTMSIERGRTAAKFALVSMIIVDAVLPHAQGEEFHCVCVLVYCTVVCLCLRELIKRSWIYADSL